MAVLSSGDGGDQIPRIGLALRISMGAVVGLIVQLVGLVAWLVQMHSNIAFHSGQINELSMRVERMDQQGTRALSTVTQRLGQIDGANDSQDKRITRNDGRIDDLIKQQVENKFWIDQLRDFIRAYSHQTPTQRTPPP